MTKLDILGRLVKWTEDLKEYDIEYQSRIAIKAQALSDFIAKMVMDDTEEIWKVYVDGAANKEGSDIEIILISP